MLTEIHIASTPVSHNFNKNVKTLLRIMTNYGIRKKIQEKSN
jgi:hypothetical protein